MRLVYVGLLVITTLLFVGPFNVLNLRILPDIVMGAVVANVAYFAGPAVETYVRWLGHNRIWPRWVMFCGGTIFSIALAIASLSSLLLPNQNSFIFGDKESSASTQNSRQFPNGTHTGVNLCLSFLPASSRCELFKQNFFWLVLSLIASGTAASASFALPQRLTETLSRENVESLADSVVRFGDPVRGAIAFFRPEMNCAKCHEPGDNGRRLGPDLTERRATSVVKLIESVLHPSGEIRKGFEPTQLLLVDGRQLSGIIVEEDETHLRLDRIEEPDKPMVVAKSEIEERKLGALSTMPESLANQLGDRTEFLDLVNYLHELATGGAPRAAQLRPTTSMAALAPLPVYEAKIDHRGMITSLDQTSFAQGAEIFRLRCASCHGDETSEGTMPTSLRFVSGKFKRGSDPYTLYQTLTHGYGMMNAQRWMVPEQKYAVIHFIREAFLRKANPSQYFPIDERYLAGLPSGDTRGPKPVDTQPWTLMNYGPSLMNTIEVSRDGSNIAQKGIAIRLDDGPGGVESGSHWMLYDHDTMRVAGAWSGEFIDYNGIHFNGVHGQHPKVAGTVHVQNSSGPGWGRPSDGSFDDERIVGRDNKRYGPLDRKWAQYRGMYRFGRQSILKYTVGSTEVLETPALDYIARRPSFVRTLNIGPRDKELVLQIARDATVFKPRGHSMLAIRKNATVAGTFDGTTKFQVSGADEYNTHDHDFAWSARIKTNSDGTIICKTLDQSDWMPNGQSLFVRDGRLAFDVGWVGAVHSNLKVADGNWHDIAMNWRVKDAKLAFFVDGRPAGEGSIKVNKPLRDSVIRIGATNDDFPQTVFFRGEIADAKMYPRILTDEEINRPDLPKIEDCFAAWIDFSGNKASDLSGNNRTAKRIGHSENEALPSGLYVSAATEIGGVDASQWIADDMGNLRLRIPAGREPIRLQIKMTSLTSLDDVEAIEQFAAAHTIAIGDLAPLIKGGPANWPEELSSELQLGNTAEPFVVDVLAHPVKNPGNDRLRMTGVDFVPNGDTLVVATWDGSIWRVSGVGQMTDKAPLRWRRIAAGLFQPLGIKIRDGVIFVTCRDQLVALHDLNDDGEIDWYECFNNDHQVTEHFHEFAMGLQTDAAGNFYYAKSARHALPALVPHHGTLLKITADGQRTEIVATGFRAANGVCLNPDGSFVVTDQEGHWNPKNRINWVTDGGFYGNMFGYHDIVDSSDSAMEPPLCWITNAMDRSPAELLWVDSDHWGPLKGALLNLSYGYGKIFIVPHEKVGSKMQGGICELPLPQFPTGIMRGRFHPVDGQLYACGMFAWSSTQEQPGGLYRIRYTGGDVRLPVGLSAIEGGLELTFTEQLSPSSANDPANFAIQVWDLKRSANYGSEHLNQHTLAIKKAELSADGRTVRLYIPDIAPTWCMEIVYAIKTNNGQPVQGKIHNTIHELKK